MTSDRRFPRVRDRHVRRIAQLAATGLIVVAACGGCRAAEMIDLTNWQPTPGPFAQAESLAGLSISVAQAFPGNGARIAIDWSCKPGGTTFAVGVMNGELDLSLSDRSIVVKELIDNQPVVTDRVIPASARRFAIETLRPATMANGNIENFASMGFLHMSFSVNGEDLTVRVPMQEAAVTRFLESCFRAQTAAAKTNPEPEPDPWQKAETRHAKKGAILCSSIAARNCTKVRNVAKGTAVKVLKSYTGSISRRKVMMVRVIGPDGNGLKDQAGNYVEGWTWADNRTWL